VAGYFVARGWGRAVWQLARYFGNWRTWYAVAARRKALRALRVRRDTEIVARFAADIMFAEVDGPTMRYLVNPLLRLYWNLVKRLIVW